MAIKVKVITETKEELDARIAAEDSTPDAELSREQLQRKKLRDRKRRQREKEAQQKAVQAEAEKVTDVHSFWELQRRKAGITPDQLHQMIERQNEILDLAEVMREYLNGTDGTTPQDLEDTIDEVAEEVKAHGTAGTEIILTDFWKPERKAFFDLLVSRGDATANFARTGVLSGLPSSVVHEFQQKFAQKPEAGTEAYDAYVTVQCTTRGCLNTTSMKMSLATQYAQLGNFRCGSCITKEQKAQAESPKTIFYKTVSEGPIFDQYGRLRDQ